MTTRYAATTEDFAAWLATAGAPRYRLDQIVDALYRQRIPIEDASSIPRALRIQIAEAFPLALTPVVESEGDDGETVKWLWECGDGAQIETVLMRYPTRATVCVSSQAGCAMGCTFCATGQAGFMRHLDAGEIVEQVVRAGHASPQPVNNVVFMGMGEPLANYDATWAAVERLHGDLGLSARHITISTVGIVPGIRKLATETLPVTLAISLHAPDDELRNTMIPINRRYPLAEVMDAAAELGEARGRRVTFEYACIAGVNDLREHAHALVRLLRPLGPRGSHVNLIPLNDTAGYAGTAPIPVRMQAFATILRDGGLTATVRKNRGTDIDAACGQLRSRVAGEPVAAGRASGAVRTIADPSARMAP
jgi:23S rRNA (adenine2503-C2)-methyltransferase